MYISILIQMILMEENTLQPSAEEKSKPQIKNGNKLEQKKVKKRPATSGKNITDKKNKLKDDSKKVNSTKKKEVKEDEHEKIKNDKIASDDILIKEKPDYTKLGLEKLINVFEELYTGDFWLKNQQNLQQINDLLKKNFKSN